MRLCLYILVSLIQSTAVYSTIIHVPADQPTIQGGINAATDGDTVLVAPGEYTENLTISNKAIVLRSSSGAGLTKLRPADAQIYTISITNVLGDGLQISGFDVSGSGSITTILCVQSSPAIQDNIIHDNVPVGSNHVVIACQGGSADFKRNIFYGNGGISCIGLHSGSVSIMNNTFDRNARGFYSLAGSHVARNNIVSNSDQYGVYGPFVQLDYNDIWNNNPDYTSGAGSGTHSISADPQYADPLNHDYSLQETSPCIDAGDPSPEYLNYDGSIGDIGAIQPTSMAEIANEDHLHVVDHYPHFIWPFDRGGLQTAYQLEVGVDLDWLVAELWNSGQQTSTDTTVAYDGAPLLDGTIYYDRFRTESGGVWTEWSEGVLRMNTAPFTPQQVSPINDYEVRSVLVNLKVLNASDDESDRLTYDFEVYEDSSMTSQVSSIRGINEQAGETSTGFLDDLLPDRCYWWRARAFDRFEYSAWTELSSFRTHGRRTLRVPSEYPTIQAAASIAPMHDTVLVADGRYDIKGFWGVELEDKEIIITSENGPQATIIDCRSLGCAFTIGSGLDSNLVIDGFTILKGYNAGVGAGIYCGGSSPIISNCVFAQNNSKIGAAVCFGGLSAGPELFPIIRNCTFVRNVASEAAAIYASHLTLRIENCIVYDNLSTEGGPPIIATIRSGHDEMPMISCTDVFKNSGGDWVGIIADYSDQHGNMSVDPFFCNADSGDYSLQRMSLCAPWANDCGLLIGAVDPSECGPITPFPQLLSLGAEVVGRVVNHSPSFYWKYVDPDFEVQISYEIEVGSDSDWTYAEMWSSGAVSSADTSATYGGLELVDGETYYYRIRLNNGTNWGDWNDSLFTMNRHPTVPVCLSPVGGVLAPSGGTKLIVENAYDADGDSLSYDYEIYSDLGMVTLWDAMYGVSEQPEVTRSEPFSEIPVGFEYFWRSRSFDGYEYSGWTTSQSFISREPVAILVPTDFPSIQTALDFAGPLDSVVVAPGVYTENLTIAEEVKLLGSGAERTLLQPASPVDSTILIAGGLTEYVEIAGFEITGGGPAHTLVILGSSPIVRNNLFRHNIPFGNQAVDVISCRGSSAVITRNLFYSNGGRACVCLVSGPAAVQIVNNTLDGNWSGIVALSQGAYAFNNIISNSGWRAAAANPYEGFDQFDYNLLWANVVDYHAYAVPGPHDIYAGPKYVAAALLEHALRPASPAVDAGHPDTEYNDPDGTRNDIGAIPVFQDWPMVADLSVAPEDFIHVISHNPSFVWSFMDTTTSAVGYEIDVGADSAGVYQSVWATGPVPSPDTTTTYAGAPLHDGTVYDFNIRLFDGSDWGTWTRFVFRMNSAPTIPIPLSPVGGVETTLAELALVTLNSADAEGDMLTYDFELFGDSGLSSLFFGVSGLAEQPGQTSVDTIFSMRSSDKYYWRVRSDDSYEKCEWSPVQTFVLSDPGFVHVPLDYPTIQSAISGSGSRATVLVGPGTYVENIDYEGKEIRLLSEAGPELTILKPADHTRPMITMASDEADLNDRIFEPTPDRNGAVTELSGFTITGDGIGLSSTVVVGGASPLISNMIFHRNMSSTNWDYRVIDCSRGSAVIQDCIFYENRGFTCIFTSSDSRAVQIINNTFDRNYQAIWLGSSLATVISNIVTGSGWVGISAIYAPSSSDFNDVWNNNPDYELAAVPGVHDISLDPMFADPEHGDYSLLPGSPCIDAGHPDPQFNDPDGSRADMGAVPGHVDFVYFCGDADQNGIVDWADLMILLDYYFYVGPRPVPLDAGDTNCDGIVDIVDIAYLAEYLSAGGAAPCCFTGIGTKPRTELSD